MTAPVEIRIQIDFSRTAEFHGLAARIVLAALDEDFDQVVALVHADHGKAIGALIMALAGMAVTGYGSEAAAREVFTVNAMRGEFPEQITEGAEQ